MMLPVRHCRIAFKDGDIINVRRVSGSHSGGTYFGSNEDTREAATVQPVTTHLI